MKIYIILMALLEKTYTTDNEFFTVEVIENDEEVQLNWIGKCTLLNPNFFLAPIFDEVLALNKKIILNFLHLDYITSSGYAPIIKLINAVCKKLGKIELRYDKTCDWQELSFSALNVLCTEDQRIQILGVSQ